MEKREKLRKFTRIFRYCQLNINLTPIKGLKSKHWIWDQRTGKRPLDLRSGWVKKKIGESRSCKQCRTGNRSTTLCTKLRLSKGTMHYVEWDENRKTLMTMHTIYMGLERNIKLPVKTIRHTIEIS